MKINGIAALDCQVQGSGLVLLLADTSLEEITSIDAALLKVETDDGEPVEVLMGYRLVRVTYEATDGTFTAVLELGVEDTTDKAMKSLAAQLREVDAAQKVIAGPMAAAVCAFAATATEIPNPMALEMVGLFPTWEDVLASKVELPAGRIIDLSGQLYRVAQPVIPQAHEPPNMDGMLAVYRPIDEGHAGTLEDPIPWIRGMDCVAGGYYSYKGTIYQVADGGSMIPCTWPPDTDGMWQWIKIKEEV